MLARFSKWQRSMMRWFGIGLMSCCLVACASVSPNAPTPPMGPELAPRPVVQLPPAAPALAAEAAALPRPAERCDHASAADDDRCPGEILHSAAMSYLGKTTAVFDGVTMQEVEIDPDLLMDEASQDVGFCQLALQADSTPADGQLNRDEALALEEAVFAALESRVRSEP